MTERFSSQQFQAKFGHGNHPPAPQLQSTKPKRVPAPALDGQAQSFGSGEKSPTGRVTVRITGYRVRPLDPDNFAGGTKSLIDQLRYCGILEGDEPWKIKLETEQVRVKHFSEERTEIQIIYP